MQRTATSRLAYVSPEASCRKLAVDAPDNIGKQLFDLVETALSQFAHAPVIYFVDPDAEKEPLRAFRSLEHELPPLALVLPAPKRVLFGAIVPQGFGARAARAHVAVFAVLSSGAIHVEEALGALKPKTPPRDASETALRAAWPAFVGDCALGMFERSVAAALARSARGHPLAARRLPADRRMSRLSIGSRRAVTAIEDARLRFEAAMTHAALRQAHGVEATADPALVAVSANRLAAADVSLVQLTAERRRARREALRLRRRDQYRTCPPLAVLFDLMASKASGDGGCAAPPPPLRKALREIDAGRSPYAVIRDLTGLDKLRQKRLAALGVDGLLDDSAGFSGPGVRSVEQYVRTLSALPQGRVPETDAEHKALLSTIAALHELFDADAVIALVAADAVDHVRRADSLGARTALRDAVADFAARIITPLLLRRGKAQSPGADAYEISEAIALQMLRPTGLKGLATFQQRWHRDLPEIEAADRKSSSANGGGAWAPLLGEIDLGEGWRARELASAEALREEGRELRHCVGSYATHVRRGRSVIFSLKHDAEGRSTCEIINLAKNPLVKQNLAKRNKRPCDGARAAGERLAAALAGLEATKVEDYRGKLSRLGKRKLTSQAALAEMFDAYRRSLEAAFGRLAPKETDVSPDSFTTTFVEPAMQRLLEREPAGRSG